MRIINPNRRTSRKKLKALRREFREKKLVEYANKINENLPKSEVWFHDKFKNESILRIFGKDASSPFVDLKNSVLNNSFIPDVMNDGYKYVIEVDGSIHDNNLKQAYKDLAKNTYYRRQQYKCFRIKAYDENSYSTFIREFKAYIELQHSSGLDLLFSYLSGKPFDELVMTKKQRKWFHKNRHNSQLLEVAPDVLPPVKVVVSVKKPKCILRKKNALCS